MNHVTEAAEAYRRAAQNETDNRLTSDMDVLEPTEDVDLLVGQDHSGATGILNGKLGFAVLPSNAANGSTQVLTVEGLDVFDLKRLNVQVVQS